MGKIYLKSEAFCQFAVSLKNKFDDTLSVLLNINQTTQHGWTWLSIPEHSSLHTQLLKWVNNTICYG